MDEWKEGIWIAASTIVVSIFLIIASFLGQAVSDSTRIEQANIENVEVLKEYYKIGAYDNVIIDQADAINCIINYKGIYAVCATSLVPPSIAVCENTNIYSAVTYDCLWDSSTPDTEYTSGKIKNRLNIGDTDDPDYRALLSKDANGAINRIQLIRLN